MNTSEQRALDCIGKWFTVGNELYLISQYTSDRLTDICDFTVLKTIGGRLILSTMAIHKFLGYIDDGYAVQITFDEAMDRIHALCLAMQDRARTKMESGL